MLGYKIFVAVVATVVGAVTATEAPYCLPVPPVTVTVTVTDCGGKPVSSTQAAPPAPSMETSFLTTPVLSTVVPTGPAPPASATEGPGPAPSAETSFLPTGPVSSNAAPTGPTSSASAPVTSDHSHPASPSTTTSLTRISGTPSASSVWKPNAASRPTALPDMGPMIALGVGLNAALAILV